MVCIMQNINKNKPCKFTSRAAIQGSEKRKINGNILDVAINLSLSKFILEVLYIY